MNNFATDVKKILEDNGLGTGYANMYVDYDRDDRNRISVFTAGGSSPITALNPSEFLERPVCRVYVYHESATTAEITINAILEFLKTQHNIKIGDTTYCLFQDRNGVNYQGRDSNNYVGYYVNISTIRRTE